MKKEIARLVEYFSEDEICTALGITHAVFRRYAEKPSIRLSEDALREIQYTQHGVPARTLVRMYKTTLLEVLRGRYHATFKTPVDLRTIASDVDLKHKAKRAGYSASDVKEFLQEPSTEETVLRLYKESKDPAAILKITPARVSQILRANGIKRRNHNRRTDWPEILAYAEMHSVAAAAKHFSVPASSIYAKRRSC